MINTSEPVHSFISKDDDEDPSLMLTILMHPGTFIWTIDMIFAACIVFITLKDSKSDLPSLATNVISQTLCDMS